MCRPLAHFNKILKGAEVRIHSNKEHLNTMLNSMVCYIKCNLNGITKYKETINSEWHLYWCSINICNLYKKQYCEETMNIMKINEIKKLYHQANDIFNTKDMEIIL